MFGEALGKTFESVFQAFAIMAIIIIVLALILIGIIIYWAWSYFELGSYHIVHTASVHVTTFL